MEQRFTEAWMKNREAAARIGVRLRPMAAEDAVSTAHRVLTGHRPSDGFSVLADQKRLDLSLEALAVDRRFTGLFSDEEANTALSRLLEAGFEFRKTTLSC